jgi:hypothetical protein
VRRMSLLNVRRSFSLGDRAMPLPHLLLPPRNGAAGG